MSTLTGKIRTTLAALSTVTVLAAGGTVAMAGTAQASDTCHITASAANIRSYHSTTSTIVGVGYKGQTCTSLATWFPTSGYIWEKIRMNGSGVVGWVRGDLVYVYSTPTCIPEYC
jgi:hypothetical protein